MKACVTISEQNIKKAGSIVEKFDIAEIRLDLCEYNSQQIKSIFSIKKDLIATYRCDKSKINAKMETLKQALESGAKYIDLEADLEDKHFSELVLFARNYGAKIIYSYHNYNETESDERLHKIIDTGKEKGADLIKLALKTNSKEDCIRIMNLYTYEKNLIAFGSGEDSKFTRIASLFLGAPFTYVYFGTAKNQLAEGQLGHRQFAEIMEGFGIEN